MGNCCKTRKSENDEEKKIKTVLLGLKLNQTSFKEIYKLIYQEEFDYGKHGPSDPNRRLKKYEFLQLAESHFYTADESLNPDLKFHKDFFELMAAKLSLENELPCHSVIFLLFSFLNDSNHDKMNFFNHVIADKIGSEKESINNIKFIEMLKEYLRINLSFTTSVMCSVLIKHEQNTERVASYEKLKRVFEDPNKLNSFVDDEFPTGTSGERLETMETLKQSNFIFCMSDLRNTFLSRYFE